MMLLEESNDNNDIQGAKTKKTTPFTFGTMIVVVTTNINITTRVAVGMQFLSFAISPVRVKVPHLAKG